MEPFKLEKTLQIKSNHYLNTTKFTTKPRAHVLQIHFFECFLDNLFQCLTALSVRKFFLYPN